MSGIWEYIGRLDPLAVSAAVVILLGGFVCYWRMAGALQQARQSLIKLADSLSTADGATSSDPPQAIVESDRWMQPAWQSTKRRIFRVGQGDERRSMLMGSVSDLWQAERLLQDRFNFRLFASAPNIAVGVGLLFTFVFLTMALTDASAALASETGSNPVDATKRLLQSAGGKFISSLAGLLVSILWTLTAKKTLRQLDTACNQVIQAIEERWPPMAAEFVLMEQLSLLRSTSSKLATQNETGQSHLGRTEELLGVSREQSGLIKQTAEDQLAMADELLTEAREQTGVLKRFETDLAVSIGKAVAAGFNPKMEEMTARLEKAITELSKRVSTMNEDALRIMLENFAKAISATTSEEMKQFKTSLGELALRLAEAGNLLKENVGQASGQLVSATGQMSEQISTAAHGLVTSVQGMDAVMDKTSDSVKDMDAVLSRAAALGAQGVEKLDASMAGAGRLIDRMGEVGQGWTQVTDEIRSLVAKLSEACDGIDELSQEQRSVARAVQMAGPEVHGAVSIMRQQLEGTAKAMAQDMDRVKDALARSSGDLSGVVSAIQEGVTQYSQQLAHLHQAMDAEMAKAINGLGGAIQSLDDAIGELNDGLDELGRRK